MTDLLRGFSQSAHAARRARLLLRLCAGLTLIPTPCALVAAQAAPTTAIAVDVTITHTRSDAGGRPLPPTTPPTTFRLERQHDGSGWRTVMSYRESPDRGERAGNPLSGARIEYHDGGAIRVYDSDGRLNTRLSSTSPDAPALPVLDGAGRWAESLVSDPQRRDTRARDLVRRYGRATGRVRNLDRYVAHHDDVEEELLADPSTGLVMENRELRRGVLERRTTFEYDVLPDGRRVRRRIRTEEREGAAAQGGPSVTTIEFSNLVAGGER